MKKRYISRMTALLLCAALTITSFPADVKAKGTGSAKMPDVQSTLTGQKGEEDSQTERPEEYKAKEQPDGEPGLKEQDSVQTEDTGEDDGQTEEDNGTLGVETEDGNNQQEQVRTESIDWTDWTAGLKLGIHKVSYQSAGEEKTAEVSGGRLDLSGMKLPEDGKLRLGITYEILRESNESGEMLQAGDTFSIDFSSAPFVCADSENPQSIQGTDGNTSAVWGCKDNRVTVTFQEPAPTVGVSTEFTVELALKPDALGEEISETEFVMQNPEGRDAVKTVIIMPAKASEKQDDAPGTETAGAEEAKTEENELKAEEPKAKESATKVTAENAEQEKIDKKKEKAEEEKEDKSGLKGFFTGRARALFLSAGQFFSEGTDRVTTKSIIKTPKEGIKKAVVSVSALRDGYSKSDDKTPFDLGLNITIDSSYLGQISSQFAEDPDFPQFDKYAETDEGYSQYQKDIDKFFEDNKDVPELTYTLNLGKGYFLNQEGTTKELKKYIDEKGDYTESETGDSVGVVSFSASEENELTVTVTFKKRVYNRTDITLGFSQELYIDKAQLDDKDKTVLWKEGKLELVPVQTTGGDTETENQPYTVDKSGPEKVTDSEITYTLTFLAPNGKTLDGMMMEEVLPTVPEKAVSGGQKYLDVKNISVNGTELSKDGSGYKIQDGKLQYTFPKDQNLTFADVVLTVNLTEAQKNAMTTAYSGNPNGFTGWELKDKANLYDKPDSAKPTASSEEIHTTIELNLLSKSGSQDSINGERFHWTVNIDTQFIGYSIKGAYLIDYINHNAHTYKEDAGVKVTMDGNNASERLSLKYLGEVTDVSGAPGSLGTPEDVENLLQDNGWSVQDGQAYYYNCGDYSVMLIPYGGAYRGHKASFTYDTDLLKSASNPDTKVTNEAKFVWNYLVGEGPGPGTPASFHVSIDKTGDAKPAQGSKTGVGYDEKNQTAKWRFQVNYYPSDEKLEDVRIEETFQTSRQLLLEDSLTYTLWDRSDSSNIKKGSIPKGSSGGEAPYYTYDSGNGECVIYLGDIETNQYYDIRMNTKVTDGDIFSAADGTAVFTNTAALTAAGPEGIRPSAELKGQVPTHTTWIQKDAVGKFDYKAKTFMWKTTVNPNHLKIKNPVVTDTLPSNNEFGELTAVERISAGGDISVGTKDSDGSGSFTVGSNSDKVQIHVSKDGVDKEKISIGDEGTEIDDTYILTYTTTVSDKAYQDFIKNNSDAGTISFINKAELTGKYLEPGTPSSTEVPVSASDDAKNSFTGRMVLKNGQYISSEGKIKWQVDVNVEQMNMQGFSILEDLTGMPFLELSTKSVEIYKMDINQDGEVSEGPKEDITDKFLSDALSTTGFTFKIPDAYAKDTLRIIFDTYFTDSIPSSEVKNTITIKTPVDNFSSNESDGNMSGDFDIDDYVKIATTPVLKILKKSNNSAGSGDDEKLPLAGAEFTMTGFKESGGNYTEDSVLGRKVTSKESGNAVFVNLTPGAVYKVAETKAPAGYALDGTPHYYLFLGAGQTAPSGETVRVGGTDIKVSDIVIYKQENGKSAYKTDQGDYPSEDLTNKPSDSNIITVTKTGQDGNTLPEGQAAFSLTPKDTGRITKDDWKEQKTDASGKVTFKSIDAGADADHKISYVLKEIKNDSIQYDQGQTFNAEAWMEGNSFKYSVTPTDVKGGNGTDAAAVTGSQESGYTIQNLYRSGKAIIKKTDAVTGDALSNSAGDYLFAIVDGADPADGSALKEYGRASSKAESGKVTFDKVPYSENGYRIAELSTQPGYVMPSGDTVTLNGKSYPVVKTISKIELDEAAAAAVGQEGKKKPAFSIDCSGQPDEAIQNERVKGTISFTKKDGNGAVLPDRTFLLWHVADNQDGSQDSYYKTADDTNTFKDPVTKENKKAWLIAEAVSDDLGNVSFLTANKLTAPNTPIAWGEYYITEKVSENDLYRPLTGQTAIHISKDNLLAGISGDKTSSDAKFAYQVQSGDTAGIVTNQLKTASFQLKKTDEIAVGEGKAKKEYLKGVAFRITGSDYDGKSVDIQAETNDEGELTFDNLRVCKQNTDGSFLPYTLTETRQQGYQNPEEYKIYITPDNAADTPVSDAKIEVKDSGGNFVYDSTKSAEAFEIKNEPISGTLNFMKKTSSSIGVFNNMPAEGAKFTLKRVVAGGEYVVAENVKSNQTGNIIFENIEFGNYRLYETKAPKGMQEISSERPVKVADITKELILGGSEFAGGAAPDSYAYTHAEDISNHLIEKTLEFNKTDELGNVLEGITFDVYRRGTSVNTEGSSMVMEVPDGTKTYDAYGVLPTVTSAVGTGEFSMTLPYGDYLLVEQNTDSGQGDEDKVAVWISVRADKVSVKQNDAMAFEPGKTEINPQDKAWKSLELKSGKYTVINYMNARITLKKVEDAKHGYAPVSGAQFQLEYKAAQGDEYKVLEEVITEEEGMFHHPGLQKGFYRLTETANIGYDISKPFQGEFEVRDSDRRKNIDLTTDRLTPAAGSEDAFQEGEGIVNTRLTGSVTLHKVDGEDTEKALEGVVFTLYRQKDAEGVWDKISEYLTGKKYEATGQEISGTQLATKGTLTIEGLDWGSYKLTETQAKSGYKNAGTSIPFTVSREGEKEILLQTDGHDVYNYQNEVTIHKRDKETKALLSGAVFTITEKGKKTVVYNGAVGDGTNGTQKGVLRIKGILTGGKTYILHEQTTPAGYGPSEDITFILGQDGTVEIDGKALKNQVITVENSRNKLQFTKAEKYNESCSDSALGAASADELRGLAGAQFTLYTDAGCTKTAVLADAQAATAVSGTDGTVVMDGLLLGENGAGRSYYMKETAVPKGNVSEDAVYKVELDSRGQIQILGEDGNLLKDNTVVNDVQRSDIRFTKVDDKNHDKVLPGSMYGLYKPTDAKEVPGTAQKTGRGTFLNTEKLQMQSLASKDAQEIQTDSGNGFQLIATAVTDENGILTFRGVLMDTVYMIRELQEPDGSLVSANQIRIGFTVDGDGNAKVSYFDDGSGTAELDSETGEIKWFEPQTEIRFAKKDESGSLLKGAALQAEDKEGNVIDSWISSDEDTHLIRGVLKAGETYQLVETKAPDGYQSAEPVKFTVENAPAGPDENRVQYVEMVDKKAEKDSETENPTSPEGPKIDTDKKEPVSNVQQDIQKSKQDNEPKTSSDAAKTGDSTNYILWLAIFLAAGGIVIRVMVKKRKEKMEH